MGFGLRQLRKSPGFAVVVIGSLTLGIGASVAIFSVVRAVLLDPFPYKDPAGWSMSSSRRRTPTDMTTSWSIPQDFMTCSSCGRLMMIS
jgi:hypothetical protein